MFIKPKIDADILVKRMKEEEKILIKTYNEVQNLKKSAKILNIDAGHLSKILKENNIEVKSNKEVQNEEYGKEIYYCTTGS